MLISYGGGQECPPYIKERAAPKGGFVGAVAARLKPCPDTKLPVQMGLPARRGVWVYVVPGS
jgi:hypothetical protein